MKKTQEVQAHTFIKFENVGDSFSGKLSNFLQGQYGLVLESGNKMINVNNTVLRDKVRRAINERLLIIGSKFQIIFIGYGNKPVKKGFSPAKIFSLYVNGKEIESEKSYHKVTQKEALKALEMTGE